MAFWPFTSWIPNHCVLRLIDVSCLYDLEIALSMSVAEQIGIEHAYRILGVPRETSAHTIKQAYRKLLKRWHPDLYAVAAHAEATEMSRVIKEAYATVRPAPLRYLKNYPGDTNFDQETRLRAN